MTSDEPKSFWDAFNSRDDLKQFKNNALLLFALQLKFQIDDISLVGANSLTDGSDDKKADLVYIDSESGHVVIAQAYISEKSDKKEAPANKASDLNTAVSWLISRPIKDLPESIKTHANELRQSIKDNAISTIHIWYVHNLPESQNVKTELITVEHTAIGALKMAFPERNNIKIEALEVGTNTVEEWYHSLLTPILVSDQFIIPISGGFEIASADWNAYITSIPAKWLYEKYKQYGTKLFSANVRDYLGSRESDQNINYGMKNTAKDDPEHFWVYNNGITALVHKFEEIEEHDKFKISINGISIVNGAQTTGAIGSLETPPKESAMVQVRFIKCDPTHTETLHNVVKYNNTQNKLIAADFRSNEPVQTRLIEQFKNIKDVQYIPRRGGYEDVIRRRQNALSSITAGQALAALHGDPETAYHKKTKIWEDNEIYCKYFKEITTAKHIIFAFSLLKAVENKKSALNDKTNLTELEQRQLNFFRKRGSIFMLSSAIARSLETILSRTIPNIFSLEFKKNLSPYEASEKWQQIIEIASSFTDPLIEGLSDGFKTRKSVENAIKTFQSLIDSTKVANSKIFAEFANEVN
jgi:hypothetical protein